MEIKHAVVVGAGTMGAGLGQLFAQNGIKVTVTDISEAVAAKGRARVEKGLKDRVEKGKSTQEEMDRIMALYNVSGSLECAKDADFVIETASENVEVKKAIFKQLDAIVPEGVIIVTNTTALPISDMALVTKRPHLVAGMHFFNPPVVMALVEIMPAMATAPETIEKVVEVAKMLGKDPVVCKSESPAGIVSRVLGSLLNEATWLYAEGVASAADIDKAMTLGARHPMGPLALVDMIGLDIHLAKMETLYRETGDPRYKPPQIVRKMVRAGWLGRKSGKGFYDYAK